MRWPLGDVGQAGVDELVVLGPGRSSLLEHPGERVAAALVGPLGVLGGVQASGAASMPASVAAWLTSRSSAGTSK
jgi:hypothetical protein